MPGISKEKFLTVRCPAPPTEAQRKFVDIIQAARRQHEHTSKPCAKPITSSNPSCTAPSTASFELDPDLFKKVLVDLFDVQGLLDPASDVVTYHEPGQLLAIDQHDPLAQ